MSSKNQPEANDRLLQEVDADLRAEQMANLWRQAKKPLIYGVLALILFTAGNGIWQGYQRAQGERSMAKLDKAIATLQQGGRADAAKQFHAIARESSGEVRDLARLWEARTYERMGENDKAVPLLEHVAKSNSGDLLWRDIACLRLMGLSNDLPKACSSAERSPLAASRDEWRAGQLWKEGKVKEARALLSVIANGDDANVPAAQRERAANLLSMISAPDEAKKAEKQ